MDDQKFCKICLCTDTKMYSLSFANLGEVYLQLLQVSDTKIHLSFVCYECASLLQKFNEFYVKCKTAYRILSCIQSDHSQISKTSVKQINRKVYNLESKLSIYSPNESNEQILFQEDIELDNKLIDIIKEEEKADYFEIVEVKSDKEIEFNKEICTKEASIIPIHSTKKRKQMNNTKKVKTKNLIRKKVKKIVENYHEDNDYVDDTFTDSEDEIVISKLKTVQKDFNNETNEQTIELKEKVRKKSGPKIDESFFTDHAIVTFLSAEEARQEVLLRKESNNYKSCPYKCEYCFRGYEVQRTFENHMKKHSKDYGQFECEFCHLMFPSQRFLKQHILTCHTRKYNCKKCSFICYSKHQAKQHVSFHKGRKYPCEECGKVFSMPNTLSMHKRVKHSTECPCDLCGSMFGTERGLATHKNLLHKHENNEGKGPKCEECGVQFSTDNAWRRHLVLSSSHKIKISNGCEICGESFPDKESLKEHTKSHSRNRMIDESHKRKYPSACTMCATLLSSRKDYKNHMMSEHPNTRVAKKIAEDQTRCVCEVCGKNFKKQYFLKYHKRIHTGERPHQCRQCGKAFTFPGALSEHMNTHTKTRVYQCHMCEKGFANRGALVKHVNAHLGIRPHKCPICEKAFPNPCHVKTHMKYVHHKEPWPKRDRSKRTVK